MDQTKSLAQDAPKTLASNDDKSRRRPEAVAQRVGNTWQTINGLVTLFDVLSTIGFCLYLRTVRYTLGVAIVLGAVLLFDRKINIHMTMWKAVTGTGMILIISCVGRLLLNDDQRFGRSRTTRFGRSQRQQSIGRHEEEPGQ